MNLLDELRGELEAEPITATGTPLLVRSMEWDVTRFAGGGMIGAGDPELHGRLAEAVSRMRVEREMAGYAAGTLRNVMQRMGYSDEETEEVASGVSATLDGEMVHLAYSAPPRVAAYMEAVASGDLLAADLLMLGGVVL